MDIRDFMSRLQGQANDAAKTKEEEKVEVKERKEIYDRLSRKLEDGDLFVFLDTDNQVKLGRATIYNLEYRWFSVLYTDQCMLWGRDYWQLDEPLDSFFMLRETRDFDSIPHLNSIVILKAPDIEKGKFYGKFW